MFLSKGIPHQLATHKQTHTYQTEDHLVKNCSQTPPVHRPVVRFLTKNLWCQVLQQSKENRKNKDHWSRKEKKVHVLRLAFIFCVCIVTNPFISLLQKIWTLVKFKYVCQICCVWWIFFTYFWSAAESRGGPLWLYALFAQAEICQHHVALCTENVSNMQKQQTQMKESEYRLHGLTCESKRIFSGFRSLRWTRNESDGHELIWCWWTAFIFQYICEHLSDL